MSKIVEDLINEEKKKIALKLLQDGKLQEEEIAKYLGFTVEQVEEWQVDKLLEMCSYECNEA